MTTSMTSTRTGGHAAIETLMALGCETYFGMPGVHTLGLWEALRAQGARSRVFRSELSAAFAADGYARSKGRPAPLLVTTGPGALMTLGALTESAVAHIPVIVIASQVPRHLIGRGKGYLHELVDQRASFAPLVKWTGRAESVESVPGLVAEAWSVASTAPSGPVYLEIPVDVLNAPAGRAPVDLAAPPPAMGQAPSRALLQEAAATLATARRPVLWAGGGVHRSGAWDELRCVAERLGSPVLTTYTGKGALPDSHPLVVGSACDEPAVRHLLSDADVVLCIGTRLGAETTGTWSLDFKGRLIHLDAAPERIGVSYPALPLVGDAKLILSALAELIPAMDRAGHGEQTASRVRQAVASRLGASGREKERTLLSHVRGVLPSDAICACDMTILGYWAAAHLPVESPRSFLYPIGSGSLGYGWPAALGAVADGAGRALAIVGDGGIAYSLSDLATARQYNIPAVLLLVDDGGYGVLRRHQLATYGTSVGVDLIQPDFAAAAASMGVAARHSTIDALPEDLSWAFSNEGPSVVVLRERLEPLPAPEE